MIQYDDVITNSRWQIALSPYLSRELSDFDQIWHTDANFNSEDEHLTNKKLS